MSEQRRKSESGAAKTDEAISQTKHCMEKLAQQSVDLEELTNLKEDHETIIAGLNTHIGDVI